MGFINEKVTEQERNKFKQKKIQNPLSPVLPVLAPVYWTIDREKDMYLFKIGTHRDYPNEEWFFFKYKEREIVLFMDYKYESPNKCIWKIEIDRICKYNKIEQSIVYSIFDELKKAFYVYQFNGKPDAENQEMKVVCEF